MHLLFKNEFCVCQRAACLGVAVPGVSMAHSAAMRRDADHRNGVDMGRLAAGGESPAAPLAQTPKDRLEPCVLLGLLRCWSTPGKSGALRRNGLCDFCHQRPPTK